jgi:hypothetical protein
MRRVLFLLLIVLPPICGCSEDSNSDRQNKEDKGIKSSNTTKLDTPEAAYAALAAAAKKDNWESAAAILTPESQAMMAAGMIMSASFVTMGDENKEKELTELLGRHGIKLDDEEPEPSADVSPSDMMMALTKPIKDLPVFLGQLSAWINKNGEDRGSGFAKLGKLGEVTIEGDTAKTISQTDMGPQPIEFRRVSGSWLVHLPMDGPPPGSGDSDLEEPDDGTPGLGTLSYGDKVIKLRHALAYKSKFFDDPCTVVLLTAKPVYDRDMNSLKQMLKEEGNDDAFFPSGTKVKLSLDAAGKLLSFFAWVDNVSINGNNGVDVDLKIDGNRVHGTAEMAEPYEAAGTEYRFQAEIDTEMIQPD